MVRLNLGYCICGLKGHDVADPAAPPRPAMTIMDSFMPLRTTFCPAAMDSSAVTPFESAAGAASPCFKAKIKHLESSFSETQQLLIALAEDILWPRVACDALEIGKGPVQAGQKSKELFRRKDKGISVSRKMRRTSSPA